MSDSIIINTPYNYQVFQRTRGQTTGNLTITGSFSGSPNHIQARVVKHGTSTEIVTWTTITGNPAGGTFYGVVSAVPQTNDGSWYNIHVRSRDVSNVVLTSATSTNKTGPGISIAIAGQSNADGRATDSYTIANDLASLYNGTTWTHLADPSSINVGALGSVAPDLANYLVSAYNIPILITNSSEGSTNLYSDWARNNANPNSNATLYGRLLNKISSVSGVEAIVWLQGESDATNGQTQSQYETNLTNFISNLRSDIGYTVPFIYNQLGNAGGVTTDVLWHGIQAAQLSRCNDSNILICMAQDLTLLDGYIHYQVSGGFNKLGPRFGNALKFYLGNSTYYRGPTISSVTYVDATKKSFDVNLTHHGGTNFIPLTGITGFTILDGNVNSTISAANQQTSASIRITLNTAISGTGYLRYLYGQSPIITSQVFDNSSLALPLEATGEDVIITSAGPTITVFTSYLNSLYTIPPISVLAYDTRFKVSKIIRVNF